MTRLTIATFRHVASACATVVLLMTPALATEGSDDASMRLRLIGLQAFDDQTITFQDTVPGGLSGIEYDPATGRYWVISDDPATLARGGARFYTVELDFDADGVDGYRFTSVGKLLRPDGTQFPEGGVDPESIR
ncbi:MAG: esterase-like activity of phytase family protein, partial [Acidobacteriota bacterium]